MRVLVVYCHPDETSFASSLHKGVLESLTAAGHSVMDTDLYREGFNPVLSKQDRANYGDPEKYVPLIEKYAHQLGSAEALVLVYPSWWYGMPAMLKGYFDRVWAPGVSYDVKPGGKLDTSRLAKLRRVAVVTTYGSPWWLVRAYMGDPARKVISRGVRQLCGRHCVIDWNVEYNLNTPDPKRLARFLERVKRKMRRW